MNNPLYALTGLIAVVAFHLGYGLIFGIINLADVTCLSISPHMCVVLHMEFHPPQPNEALFLIHSPEDGHKLYHAHPFPPSCYPFSVVAILPLPAIHFACSHSPFFRAPLCEGRRGMRKGMMVNIRFQFHYKSAALQIKACTYWLWLANLSFLPFGPEKIKEASGITIRKKLNIKLKRL